MSTDALALSKPLHERIYERIRDSIGDLMSDEDLKILVDKATEKAFFEPVRTTESSGYHSRDITKPPVLVEKVAELLDAPIKAAVEKYLAENQEKVAEIIATQLEGKFSQVVMRSLDEKMYTPMENLKNELRSKLGVGVIQY